MAFEFKLPDLGEGVQEGEIVRWLVAEGDTVAPEQHLVEVMTDKVTAELPAPVGGRIARLHGAPGDVVPVGTTLVEIDPDPECGVPPVAEPSAAGGPAALPAVRRLARELGVDLAAVTGSGPGGRILEGDVRAAAGAGAEVRREPLRGVRRAIAEHLVRAHRDAAPYTYVEEVDFTELVSLRDRLRTSAEQAGARLTYLPLILGALSRALAEHPRLNATVDEANGDLLIHARQNIGVAVHAESGLVVPVIRDLAARNLLAVAREIERLAEAARTGSLAREDVSGGTFTVTSLGRFGGLMATPMLNAPEVAILGIHRIAPRPVVREGKIVARQTANLSLTLDHRYLDGAAAALFMDTLRRYLEDPALLLFWLAELKPATS